MVDLGCLRGKFETELEVNVHPILVNEAEQSYKSILASEALIN